MGLGKRGVQVGIFIGVAAGVVGLGGPVAAQTQTYADPRDSSASSDVTSVAYADREFTAVTTVKVRDLPRAGSLLVRIAAPDSDVIYNARVTRSAAGKLTRRLTYVTNTSATQRTCNFQAAWSLRGDSVTLTVPHSCLRFGQFLTKHWMQASFTAGGRTDDVLGRVIGRGDTPGCVTPMEFSDVRRGDPLESTHARLDTAGRFGDGAAGGFSRIYRGCSGGTYWIEYDGRSLTVAGKGR